MSEIEITKAEGQKRYCPRSIAFGLWYDEEGVALEMILVLDESHEVVFDLGFAEPYLLAADLNAIGDELKRMAGAQLVSDSQVGRAEARARRLEMQAGLRDASISLDSHCDLCKRRVFLIAEDGARLCKRHAEEAGVRPKGKIA